MILEPPQTSASQEHQYLANGKRQELSQSNNPIKSIQENISFKPITN
jgi:hypothetical protein